MAKATLNSANKGNMNKGKPEQWLEKTAAGLAGNHHVGGLRSCSRSFQCQKQEVRAGAGQGVR